MKGDLKSKFEKEGKLFEKIKSKQKLYFKRGKGLKLHGRSLFTCKKRWAFND